MKVELNGTPEEVKSFFSTVNISKVMENYVLEEDDSFQTAEEAVKNQVAHYSTSKSKVMLVKDMEKFHIMATLKNYFRDMKLGELYDNIEFKSMILNLADYIGTDIEEEEMEKG